MVLRTFAARRITDFDARKPHHITRHAHQQSMDVIQKYAQTPERGIK
jgi:hypothetical protein